MNKQIAAIKWCRWTSIDACRIGTQAAESKPKSLLKCISPIEVLNWWGVTLLMLQLQIRAHEIEGWVDCCITFINAASANHLDLGDPGQTTFVFFRKQPACILHDKREDRDMLNTFNNTCLWHTKKLCKMCMWIITPGWVARYTPHMRSTNAGEQAWLDC